MIYCLITKAELFPFAPYTMYANRYSPQEQRMLIVHLQNRSGAWVELEDQIIRPLDEARLKQAILTNYFAHESHLDTDSIRDQALDVLGLASKNGNFRYRALRLQIFNYDSLEQLRSGQGHVLKELIVHD
jgi:hypothetical protein